MFKFLRKIINLRKKNKVAFQAKSNGNKSKDITI